MKTDYAIITFKQFLSTCGRVLPEIVCADGFKMSVQVSEIYGFVSEIYGFITIDLIEAIVEKHGGIDAELTFKDF